MGTQETSRENCPDRILDDFGSAFSTGAAVGSAFHFLNGVRNSPKGERLIGGVQTMRMNAPRFAGTLAAFGGLFSIFDCAMVYSRQKEDHWNSIVAAAATSGFLQIRQGLRPAFRSALYGGAFFALMEGTVFMLHNAIGNQQNTPITMEDPILILGGEIGFEVPNRPPQFDL